MTKKIILCWGILSLMFVDSPLFSAYGSGEDWPQKTVTIVVGSGPGSSFDVMARHLAKSMEK